MDVEQVVPLVEELHATLGVLPGQLLADAGYCSAANLYYAWTVEASIDGLTEFFIATGQVKHVNVFRRFLGAGSRLMQPCGNAWRGS